MEWLVIAMQASIAVPMAVVWWRRRHFSAPVKLLSWYVYLSAASVIGAGLLYPAYIATNYGFIIGFNLGKIALFGAVYYQVMETKGARQFVVASTVVALVGALGVVAYDVLPAVKVSRVVQCTLLASFALLYLEQAMTSFGTQRAFSTPLWLLSVGQLLYSAGTVSVFSMEYLHSTRFDFVSKFSFVSVSGLVFNYFLTLVFLRARVASAPVPRPEAQPTKQLAGF